LLTEASITRASRPSWVQGILQAGAAGMGGYAGAGGTLPSRSPRSSQLTGVQVTGRRVPTTMTTAPSRRIGPR
jgi:hypothetical protein